jgi:type II secretory pathway pseudopilin PulG
MNQKGQGLVEALIALGAAVVIISAITVAVITSVQNTDFSKYQNLATNYAQQGLAIVKQQSLLDWNNTATYGGTFPFCLNQGATTLPPLSSTSCQDINAGNMFIRQVDIQNKIVPGPVCNGSNPSSCCNNFTSPCCIVGTAVDCNATPQLCSSRVTVTVKWTDGKCSANSPFCHNVKLDSCLQDIYRTK